MFGPLAGFLRRNWFLLGMLAAILLGLLAPEAGRSLNPGSATRLGLIAVLFLIAGFTLPSESIAAGLASWRLHLYVQAFLFLLTPALFSLTSLPLRGLFGPELSAGILALSVLPTTIASCVVFTQVSGGNVMGTLFNAALSNLSGVFLSPLPTAGPGSWASRARTPSPPALPLRRRPWPWACRCSPPTSPAAPWPWDWCCCRSCCITPGSC
jgi:predicted Na+-dependent transporter